MLKEANAVQLKIVGPQWYRINTQYPFSERTVAPRVLTNSQPLSVQLWLHQSHHHQIGPPFGHAILSPTPSTTTVTPLTHCSIFIHSFNLFFNLVMSHSASLFLLYSRSRS